MGTKPVQPYLMDNLAFALLAMPDITHDYHTYDTMAVCVARQGGWMVVTPPSGQGLRQKR